MVDIKWILNSNSSARFHFKTFLVPVPFPVVTTFKTAGTHRKWQWPNSAHITYVWHALLLWHTYLHTYIYIYIRTTPARICTPLISVSLASPACQLCIHVRLSCYYQPCSLSYSPYPGACSDDSLPCDSMSSPSTQF